MLDSFMQMGMGAAAFLSVVVLGITVMVVSMMSQETSRQSKAMDHAERMRISGQSDNPSATRKR